VDGFCRRDWRDASAMLDEEQFALPDNLTDPVGGKGWDIAVQSSSGDAQRILIETVPPLGRYIDVRARRQGAQILDQFKELLVADLWREAAGNLRSNRVPVAVVMKAAENEGTGHLPGCMHRSTTARYAAHRVDKARPSMLHEMIERQPRVFEHQYKRARSRP